MHIITCTTDDLCKFDVYEAELSKPVPGDNPEGWGGEGGGRGVEDGGPCVHPWLIHMDVWQKPPQYCKVISFQLKLINLKNTTILIIKNINKIKK